MHGRYVTDILKMCLKNFNAEKNILTSLQDFDLHIAGGGGGGGGGGNTVSLACSQFLVTIFFQVLYVLCFTRPIYQVSVYRAIGLRLLNILRTNGLIETKFCIHIIIDKIYVGIVNRHFCHLIALWRGYSQIL